MINILIALAIGITAGIIDVIPMLIQKLDKRANWSAFIHWVVLGLIIPFVSWKIDPWLKGLIIGELAAIPIILIVAKEDKKAMIPILIFSAILGIGVAIAGAYFIQN
jgi:Mn2+/Fe2+ NRAMP family transporter